MCWAVVGVVVCVVVVVVVVGCVGVVVCVWVGVCVGGCVCVWVFVSLDRRASAGAERSLPADHSDDGLQLRPRRHNTHLSDHRLV